MSDETPNLALPFILPAQAQKHVTHNEALLALDALTQLVITADGTEPPPSPADGTCYWILPDATGAWSGKSGRIAARQDGAWSWLLPRRGWRAFHLASGRLTVFDGTGWQDAALSGDGSLDRLGINATADTTNRLSVASDATLLSHDGTGHQLKLNKAAPTDTASLLFQSAWSGRAEMGLAGSDEFSLKVSPDGSNWITALAIGGNGVPRMETRPAVRAARSTIDQTPASGSTTGFDAMPTMRGGFALGTPVPSGVGARLVVPVSGLYMVGLQVCLLSQAAYGASIVRNGSQAVATLQGQSNISGALTATVTSVTFLTSGDWLAISHQGSAAIGFGAGRTEIFAVMI